MASGRHQNRAGAYGDSPRPAETCSHESCQRDSHRARPRSEANYVPSWFVEECRDDVQSRLAYTLHPRTSAFQVRSHVQCSANAGSARGCKARGCFRLTCRKSAEISVQSTWRRCCVSAVVRIVIFEPRILVLTISDGLGGYLRSGCILCTQYLINEPSRL